MKNISITGVGNMGAALIRGILGSNKSIPSMIRAYDTDHSKSAFLAEHMGINVVENPAQLVTPSVDFFIVAVKPGSVGWAVKEASAGFHHKLIIVSIAAGVPTDVIAASCPTGSRVIRAMPNAAAMIGQSATALCKGGSADDSDLDAAADLFSALGITVKVEEKLMNAVTALSGGGPGYLFVLMEAFVDAGVLLGLDRLSARSLAVQTFLGAAKMAKDETPFSQLKDRITSPGGTTISALQIMERAGIRGIIMDALVAAEKRGFELAGKK